MDKKCCKKLLCVFLVVFFAGVMMCEFVMIERKTYTYKKTEEVFKNPMMGFAPNADYIEAVGDNTLVYVDVTWRELEPDEGRYAFADIEDANFLEKWREQGKKIVFRFVCDKPGAEEHMDIPDWLYEKTQDGTFYDCAYGRGYSPDYENPVFIRYHQKAIEALGERYGADSFFCFIELGSLGHWGEWHVNYEAGIKRFPSEDVCRQYVLPYMDAFPNAILLMRRPFSFVTEYGLGVFNDMTGEPKATSEWLNWISKGGVYDEASEPMNLVSCKNVWEDAPVGGEFTSALSMEEMLVTKQEQTLRLLQESHMTFVGPMCPIANVQEKEYPKETAAILENLGYCYRVTESKIKYNKMFKTAVIELAVKNEGVAPMYFSWPLCLYIMDENGRVKNRIETDLDLTQIVENQTMCTKIKLQGNIMNAGMPTIAIGIENPETGNTEVFLDMDTEQIDKKYLLNPD